jgi:hypothetical protein
MAGGGLHALAERGFHFHTGRPLARLLGYPDEWLNRIPE